jgi:uncharacterized membrane protein YphA (DoxX/SURF4 family)
MNATSATTYTHAALRIVTGLLFVQHGHPKLFGTLPGSAEAETPVEFLSIFVFLYLAAAEPASGAWMGRCDAARSGPEG